jgi:hypothetical protein
MRGNIVAVKRAIDANERIDDSSTKTVSTA